MLTRKTLLFVCTMIFALLLSACGSNNENAAPSESAPAASETASATPSASASAPAESATKVWKDVKGRDVEVPTDPQRIVYVGSNPGDLLAIGVKPVGATLSVIASQIAYPELIEGIEDVGYPYSAEKVLALKPDLIIFDDWDEAGLDALTKIAPTVVSGLDDATPTKERVTSMADMLGRKDAAVAWFSAYEAKVADTKGKLGLTGDETAVALLILGKDLYIMGDNGLNMTLYSQLGIKPSEGVQKELLDKNERFIGVSNELLPNFVGTDIFLLTDETEETAATQATLLGTSLWKTLPAVKNDRVHIINSKFNYDDPITLERLLDEIVGLMSK
ncbi:ABC transporter substrate-binding protein [Cohnella sp. GCM10027633]|uniref:ABC transporter substrate-binding protein n=1 Tax=unclassified Cohnella TaxID=2636738 RepID=UPI00363D3E80